MIKNIETIDREAIIQLNNQTSSEEREEFMNNVIKHEDTGTHFHVYLEFHQRVELFKSTCLDLVFNDVVYHGKYETARKKDAALRYIVKAGNFISYPELPFLDGELYIDFREYLTQLHKKGGISLVKNNLLNNPNFNVITK